MLQKVLPESHVGSLYPDPHPPRHTPVMWSHVELFTQCPQLLLQLLPKYPALHSVN